MRWITCGFVLVVVALSGPYASAAFAQQAMVEDVAVFYAVVESIDLGERTVLVRAPDGLVTVHVGPEVKNLAQVKAGDRVRIALREALVAQLSPPGSTISAPQVEDSALTAKLGEKPASFQSKTIRASVRVTGVDAANNTVQFVGPAGVPRVARVRDPSMQALLRQLKIGDKVEMTYSVAVATRVEPAGT